LRRLEHSADVAGENGNPVRLRTSLGISIKRRPNPDVQRCLGHNDRWRVITEYHGIISNKIFSDL